LKHRIDKINELIKRELGTIIERDFDFEGAMVTVLDAQTTKDLARATVVIAVYPFRKAEGVLTLLQARGRYLKGMVNKKINIRTFPDLVFKIDRGSANAERIDKLLDETMRPSRPA